MNSGMHALSLYLDTSVIGGYFDAEFMADTRALWRLKGAEKRGQALHIAIDRRRPVGRVGAWRANSDWNSPGPATT